MLKARYSMLAAVERELLCSRAVDYVAPGVVLGPGYVVQESHDKVLAVAAEYYYYNYFAAYLLEVKKVQGVEHCFAASLEAANTG